MDAQKMFTCREQNCITRYHKRISACNGRQSQLPEGVVLRIPGGQFTGGEVLKLVSMKLQRK